MNLLQYDFCGCCKYHGNKCLIDDDDNGAMCINWDSNGKQPKSLKDQYEYTTNMKEEI